MKQLKQEISELSGLSSYGHVRHVTRSALGPVVRTENDLQELRTTLRLVLESLHDVKAALLGIKPPCHVRDSGAQTNLSDDNNDAAISLLPLQAACDTARCAATGNLRAEEATVATITTTSRLTSTKVSKKTAERGTTSYQSIRPYLVAQQQQQQQRRQQEAPAQSHRKRNATSSATAQCQGTASGLGKQSQAHPRPLNERARVDASEAASGAKALFGAEDDDTVTCLSTNTSASSFLNSTSPTPTKARAGESLKDRNRSEMNKIRRMISQKLTRFHRRKPRGQTRSPKTRLDKADAAASTAHAWSSIENMFFFDE
eukprot:1178334-Prorocentrum_minimum.AAC.4